MEETIIPLLKEHIKPGNEFNPCRIFTDGAKFYSDLGKLKGFRHHIIKHNKTFGKAKLSTNKIESYWDWCKNKLKAQYHNLPQENLYLFLDEMCFRRQYGEETKDELIKLLAKITYE